MAFQGTIVTLTTAATAIAGVSATEAPHGNIRVTVRNRGTGTAYLGGSDVTTGGFPLTTADDHVDLIVAVGESLYGTSTGAAVAQVLRSGGTT
jgi:hypothetical protein